MISYCLAQQDVFLSELLAGNHWDIDIVIKWISAFFSTSWPLWHLEWCIWALWYHYLPKTLGLSLDMDIHLWPPWRDGDPDVGETHRWSLTSMVPLKLLLKVPDSDIPHEDLGYYIIWQNFIGLGADSRLTGNPVRWKHQLFVAYKQSLGYLLTSTGVKLNHHL